jgi:hypothetical protein
MSELWKLQVQLEIKMIHLFYLGTADALLVA